MHPFRFGVVSAAARSGATLDFLAGGRFELGIGAGRPGAEEDNRLLGIPVVERLKGT